MKIGIITYHAAYNYGSALQAYATQMAIEKLGYDVEIINYRIPEQKKVYKLYRTTCGTKNFFRDIIQLPVHFKRCHRVNSFENSK